MNVALSVAGELKVGCRVEYLAYKHQETDHIKVIKIEQVIDLYWDEEVISEEKVNCCLIVQYKEQNLYKTLSKMYYNLNLFK